LCAATPGRARTAGENAMLGGVAGAVTGLVTTPLDVARTAEVCALSAGMKCKVGGGRDWRSSYLWKQTYFGHHTFDLLIQWV
jgi:hypothetical protein